MWRGGGRRRADARQGQQRSPRPVLTAELYRFSTASTITAAGNEKQPPVVHQIGSGEPQKAACLYERLISEWRGVRLTLLRKKGFLHLRLRYFKNGVAFLTFKLFNLYFLFSPHLRKNTAFSCGVFAVHLFYQHILVPVTGLEPVRCRQRWILSPIRLPIPSHRQKQVEYSITSIQTQEAPQKFSKFCRGTIPAGQHRRSEGLFRI